MPDTPDTAVSPPEPTVPGLVGRGLVGGLLMGLANLVPGISGGTMLVACGVYTRFIEAIAEVTRFRFRWRSLVTLGSVVAAAAVAVLLLAGPVKVLVVERRWIMYSLFVGLTLGGVPVIKRMIGRLDRPAWIGAAAGFAGMTVVALVQWLGFGAGGGDAGSSIPMLFVGGVAGASAMILPGISGGYLLLVLGQYVPILAAISQFKDALRAMDLAAAMGPALRVMLPVGLGVLIGVVGVSNLLRWLLARWRRATLGVLLGLLFGAVVGLYPFQESHRPTPGDIVKGRVVTAENLPEIEPDDYPVRVFTPAGGQILGGLLLIGVGFGITGLIARLEPRRSPAATE